MDKDKMYLDSINAFNVELNLNHYTTFDGLKKIIDSKRFRLTRIDQISDPLEVKFIDRIWKERTYIGCFTNRMKMSKCGNTILKALQVYVSILGKLIFQD